MLWKIYITGVIIIITSVILGRFAMAVKRFSKELILEKAFEISKQNGVHGLSMRNLSKQLGCSVMPIYDAFDSKDDLLQELSVYCFNKTVEAIDGTTVFERYRKLVELGMKYPQFVLDFVHISAGPDAQEEVSTKLFNLMRQDSRMKHLSDDKLNEINSRIELVTIGLVYLYKNVKAEDKPIDKANDYIQKTAQLIIDGLC